MSLHDNLFCVLKVWLLRGEQKLFKKELSLIPPPPARFLSFQLFFCRDSCEDARSSNQNVDFFSFRKKIDTSRNRSCSTKYRPFYYIILDISPMVAWIGTKFLLHIQLVILYKTKLKPPYPITLLTSTVYHKKLFF